MGGADEVAWGRLATELYSTKACLRLAWRNQSAMLPAVPVSRGPTGVGGGGGAAQLSAAVLGAAGAGGAPPDRRLLLLLSNCAHVRTHTVPALTQVRARGLPSRPWVSPAD